MSIADKLTSIAENVPKVYQTGKDEGFGIGYGDGYQAGLDDGFSDGWVDNENMVVRELDDPVQKVKGYVPDSEEPNYDSIAMIQYIDENLTTVYENGQKSEYDRFWDAYQENGTRTDYRYAFSVPWTDNIFKPKYDIVFGSVDNRFVFVRTHIQNLEKCLNDAGVVLDTSRATLIQQMFQYADSTKVIPTISTVSSNLLSSMFDGMRQLVTIRKLILKDEGTQTFSNTFMDCIRLENIIIEGVIGNDFDIHWSPLSKESIKSIMTALSNNVTGKTVTFNKSAVNNAFGINVDDESTYPVGSEYHTLRHSKDNWTFSYMNA